jgi:hypothetical protein
VKLKRRSSHGTRRGEKRKGAAAGSANKEKLRRGILAELGKAPSTASPLSNRYAHQGSTIFNDLFVQTEGLLRFMFFRFSELFCKSFAPNLQNVPKTLNSMLR